MELVLYGISLLANEFSGTVLDIEVDQAALEQSNSCFILIYRIKMRDSDGNKFDEIKQVYAEEHPCNKQQQGGTYTYLKQSD